MTDRLIPLYAVGAFLAFTLSQAGMVKHWLRARGPHWGKSAFVNGLGAFVTGVTVLVVLVAKFTQGAWMTLLFMPLTMLVFHSVRRHYHTIAIASQCTEPMTPHKGSAQPIVVVPLERWNTMSKQALEFARKLSPDVIGLHVEPGERAEAALLEEDWERYVAAPYREIGEKGPELKLLASPYRYVVVPVVQYVLQLAEKNPERKIVVVIPEMVEEKWYEYFLHNQRARLLEWTLLAKGNDRIYTVASPYYLSMNEKPRVARR